MFNKACIFISMCLLACLTLPPVWAENQTSETFSDGVWEGHSPLYKVSVTLKNNKITAIKILENTSQNNTKSDLDQIIQMIIDKQDPHLDFNPENFDELFDYQELFYAVRDALIKAIKSIRIDDTPVLKKDFDSFFLSEFYLKYQHYDLGDPVAETEIGEGWFQISYQPEEEGKFEVVFVNPRTKEVQFRDDPQGGFKKRIQEIRDKIYPSP